MDAKIIDNNFVNLEVNEVTKNFVDEQLKALYAKRFDTGLCSTCDLAITCTLPPRKKQQRVVHCEEYDKGYSTDKIHNNKRFFPYDENDTDFNPVSFRGLCRNCEKRNFCTLAKPLVGIWFCEEYE